MDWFCQALRWQGLMNMMKATNTGRPATTTVARVGSVAYMNTTMKITLMISRMELMMPLDRISDTELT